ncbi:DNA polymerase III subunit alpha [Thiohalorhabdus methylotrophus]|uniref:DNA-directed DNA polymerase n=1 Tax=Thiohalorhabdus methylotrophus TaxID=3242694 RepID=A0ABV4TXC2_9GAMM
MRAVHLCAHSHYSFRYGIDSPQALADAAAARGIDAIALTDVEGLYGAVDFYRAALAAEIKPLLGARLADGERDPGCVVLARDRSGYRALCRLLSARRLGGEWRAIAREAAGHLFFLAGSRAWVDRLDCAPLRAARALFVRRVPADLCRNREERAARERLARYARHRRLPLAAALEAAFLDPEAFEAHRVAVAMRAGTTIARLDPALHAPEQAWLRDAEHLRAAYVDDREALENALHIAGACADRVLDGMLDRLCFPPFPLASGEDAAGYLRRLCRSGLRRRYGEVVPLEAQRRLQRELAVITDMGYATYFLVVRDIVEAAEARGIPTLGRGSVANSIVAYVLRITHVEPVAHGLFFERFLNPERRDPPDIDLDFPWDRRDEMVDYVYARYGAERVAMVGAFTTFESRGLVQEIGAALGFGREELAEVSRRLPRVPLHRLPQALGEHPAGIELHPDREPLATVLRVGAYLDGNPKGLGTHPCGLVIAPDRVDARVPVERSPKGLVTTQYAMYPAEALGLIKIDLLGNRSLTALLDTVAAVRAGRGEAVDFDALDPAEDPATRDLVARGATMGCFYIESPSMRQVQARLDCRDFETLVAASSIIRPGVSHSGVMERFIRRHRGEERVEYAHPALREVLDTTCGVMIYQEDVIRTVGVVAGMSLGEADDLRRCMSKKRDWNAMETYRARFAEGARERGVTEETIEQLWTEIESFAGYAFCKAHSASFALLSFQVAYLKAHFPAEFLAAVLANGGGYYGPQAYVDEAKRLGVAVRPPHVNGSTAAPRAEPDPEGRGGWAIRLGLDRVRDLTGEAAAALAAERGRNGAFADLEDLIRRVPVLDRAGLEALVGCGALDGLGSSRRALFWTLEGRGCGHGRATGTGDLFPAVPQDPEPAPVAAESAEERLRWELAYLGLTASDHPLVLFRHRLAPWRQGMVAAARLADHHGRRVRMAGWQVTRKSARTRAGDRPMCFLTLEDRTGLGECVLFPDAYATYGGLLHGFGPFVTEGVVRLEQGVATLEVDWLRAV